MVGGQKSNLLSIYWNHLRIFFTWMYLSKKFYRCSNELLMNAIVQVFHYVAL